MMQLEVRGQQTHVLQLTGEEKVALIKDHVASLESIDVTQVLLYSAGVPLEDDDCVSSIVGNIVDLNIGLKGGKVHGSLARAGKVRGQTPKVEKQEKKKQKTGRAKRRQQYNRRFVNIVQQFGRRRGPNTNS